MLQNKSSESGNVFIFILLGVVLFAALSFSIARGFRSDTTSMMTARQTDLMATDILNYAQRVNRSVDRARQKGCSENQLNFQNGAASNVNLNAPADGHCGIFSPYGGGIIQYVDTQKAGYQPENGCTRCNGPYISGEAMLHPDAGQWSAADLMLWLAGLDRDVCIEINKKLGITNTAGEPPDGTAEILGGTRFVGTYGAVFPNREARGAGGELENQMTGCFLIGTSTINVYAFYSVLLAR